MDNRVAGLKNFLDEERQKRLDVEAKQMAKGKKP